jgi:cation transport regulator
MELQTRPYSGPGDDTLPDNVKALPEHAKAVWVAAFNSAYDSWSADKTDQPREGYAFAVAWAAVKRLYKKDSDGNWSKRSAAFEGDGYLTRVWESADGARHWRANVMDDGVDQYATRMTIEFQDDVCGRAALGGLPWLGVAHFGKESQIGQATRLYRDGRVVKAEGVFLDAPATPLQAELVEAAWAAALKESDLLPAHRSICTSQAFYPEGHIVEDCGVLAYTRGRMDHIALTVRPGNSRADFGVEEDNMRTSKSRRRLRREDAAAIVGEDLAGRLDQANRKANVRSVEEDGLIYRMYDLEGADGVALEVSADGENWEDVTAGERAGVPTHRPALNDAATEWDAGGARNRVWEWATDAEGNFDGGKAHQGFAIFDSENPDNKTGMALPHHDIADGKLVTHQRGVMAAGNVVMGGRGGFKEFQSGDTEKAKTHLGVHYGQMDRTPPWKREESNLRHWAEAMEEVEGMAAAGYCGESDVANARAFLRHRIGDGTIALPALAGAVEMFAGDAGLGGAVLRATGEADFAAAIRAIVRDPDSVGAPVPAPAPAPENRVGRRVRGEMLAKVSDALKQFTSAAGTMKEFVAWASENLRADSSGPAHRALLPDSDYRAELTDRWGMEGVSPSDSVIGAMNEHQLMEAAYAAGYTFLDIVIANVGAAPEDLNQQDRLANVQRALNEFGQIIASIIAQAAPGDAQRSSGAAAEPGVKPEGAGGANQAPAGGPDPEARAAVAESLAGINAAIDRGADAVEVQGLLEQLTDDLRRCLPAPASDPTDVQIGILGRLRAIEDQLRAAPEPAPVDDGQRAAPNAPPAAPPRRKGFTPRLETEVLRQSRNVERPGQYGWSPSQFARGAHHRAGFDPRA